MLNTKVGDLFAVYFSCKIGTWSDPFTKDKQNLTLCEQIVGVLHDFLPWQQTSRGGNNILDSERGVANLACSDFVTELVDPLSPQGRGIIPAHKVGKA